MLSEQDSLVAPFILGTGYRLLTSITIRYANVVIVGRPSAPEHGTSVAGGEPGRTNRRRGDTRTRSAQLSSLSQAAQAPRTTPCAGLSQQVHVPRDWRCAQRQTGSCSARQGTVSTKTSHGSAAQQGQALHGCASLTLCDSAKLPSTCYIMQLAAYCCTCVVQLT